MEEKILQQQEELEMLRRRLEEIETELTRSNGNNEGSGFAKRLMEIYADEDPGMEKSMDLDKSLDMEMGSKTSIKAILGYPFMENLKNEEHDDDDDVYVMKSTRKPFLSTVMEEDEEEKEEEVQKEVIEEKVVYPNPNPNPTSGFSFDVDSLASSKCGGQDTAVSRDLRIQTIFTLCGNQRELSQKKTTEDGEENKKKPVFDSKENCCSPLSSLKEKSDVAKKHSPLENKIPFSSLENKLSFC